LRYGIRTAEASAYMQITPALVKFRRSGLDRDARGTLTISNRVLASPNLGGTDHGLHARS
jgi:trans-AT polyketide synthase/acyltransferase/oxidoreductase domain-containing protein